MTPLNQALAAITGLPDPLHERDVLKFPARKIVAIPHDPLAHAVNAVREAAHDFTFAIAEASNAQDRDGLAELQGHISACIEALQVVESMASDFERRMR